MIQYVLGFAFQDNYVVLIKKNSPDWQKDKWNGVGGKIKLNELPKEAMVREFHEETGLLTDVSDWAPYAILKDDRSFEVYVYYSNRIPIYRAVSSTNEQVSVANLLYIEEYDTVHNVLWLIEMAKAIPNGGAPLHIITERYGD